MEELLILWQSLTLTKVGQQYLGILIIHHLFRDY